MSCASSFVFFFHLTAYFTQQYFLSVLYPVKLVLKHARLKAKSPLSKLCHLSVTRLLYRTTWICRNVFTACPAKFNSFMSPATHFSGELHLGSENPAVQKSPPRPAPRVSHQLLSPPTAGMRPVGKTHFARNAVHALSPEYTLTYLKQDFVRFTSRIV